MMILTKLDASVNEWKQVKRMVEKNKGGAYPRQGGYFERRGYRVIIHTRKGRFWDTFNRGLF